MADTAALYDDVILDHIKNARNFRALEHADRMAEGVNPLCGDSFTVYVMFEDEVIRDASFLCSCCGISMASASVMTEAVKGKTIEQAKELIRTREKLPVRQVTEIIEKERSASREPYRIRPALARAVIPLSPR